MTNPFRKWRAISIIKKNGLANASTIYNAAAQANISLSAACALMQQESGGRNVYGHDAGGALSGYPNPVDLSNFAVFRWLVAGGQTSNGVGPAQITYPGLFDQMVAQGLKPWVAHDNMLFGFRLLAGYHKETGTWQGAGTKYNGSTTYGDELLAKVHAWRTLLAPAKVS